MLPTCSRPLPTQLCLQRAARFHRHPRSVLLARRSAAVAAVAAPLPVSHKHNVSAGAGPGDPDDRKDRPDEYELRVGFAIATLQDDLPQFFSKGLTEHSIYAQNIVLSDPHYTKISVHGHTVYLGIAETLRWSLRMYFDDILFEITRLRVLPEKSPLDENKGIVRHLEVRWRLQGTRHPPLVFGRILGLYTSGAVQHYEGDFLYTFDDEGRIGEHRIQRIVPPPSRRILWMHSLGGRLRAYWEEAKRRRIPELTPASVKV